MQKNNFNLVNKIFFVHFALKGYVVKVEELHFLYCFAVIVMFCF